MHPDYKCPLHNIPGHCIVISENGGGGGGGGGPNFPLPISFSPGSHLISVGFHLFAFFRIVNCYAMLHNFSLFSHLWPPLESCFLPPFFQLSIYTSSPLNFLVRFQPPTPLPAPHPLTIHRSGEYLGDKKIIQESWPECTCTCIWFTNELNKGLDCSWCFLLRSQQCC